MQVIEQIIKRKKFFVFDFDGVIADSVGIKTQAFAAMYQQYGSEVEAQVVEYHEAHGGVSRYKKLRYFEETLLSKKVDEQQLEALAQQFADMVLAGVIAAPEISGAEAFIKKLKVSGKHVFVNTGTPQEEIAHIVKLRGLASYFDGVYGSPATKIQNLIKIEREHDIDFSCALFFGDASTDLEAANHFGIDFVCVGNSLECYRSNSVFKGLIKDFRQTLEYNWQ